MAAAGRQTADPEKYIIGMTGVDVIIIIQSLLLGANTCY